MYIHTHTHTHTLCMASIFDARFRFECAFIPRRPPHRELLRKSVTTLLRQQRAQHSHGILMI